AYDSGIAVEAERELGEIIRTDGHAVKDIEKFVSKEHVRGYLAHHIDWRGPALFPVREPLRRELHFLPERNRARPVVRHEVRHEAALGHGFLHLDAFFDGPAE